jgi:hypothetical protein
MGKKQNRTLMKIKKYTAFAPKTLRATRRLGSNVLSRLNSFFNSAANTLKTSVKRVDRKVSRSIRFFTKKRHHK